jgi:hypothetical protein
MHHNQYFYQKEVDCGNIEGLMRDCVKAMAEGNSNEASEFFADDGVWITPFGLFVGKEQINKLLNWPVALLHLQSRIFLLNCLSHLS